MIDANGNTIMPVIDWLAVCTVFLAALLITCVAYIADRNRNR